MKKILSKSATKKILIVILIVILFNFMVPNYSHADFGGVLFDPLVDLIAAIGDAVLSALQYFMYDGNISLQGRNVFYPLVPNLAFSPTQYNMQANESDAIYTLHEGTLDDKGWLSSLGTALGDLWDWVSGSPDDDYQDAVEDSNYSIPIIQYTPDKIFANKIPALDANFISPKNDWDKKDPTINQEMNDRSVTNILHDSIAGWYVALRNLAMVILLSVLLYVGIRIVISSTAADKAKYKQMIMDWVIALCLLFFLHYIMLFILTLVETITDGISSASNGIVVAIYTDENMDTLVENRGLYNDNVEELVFKTDLTGLCRLLVQSKELSSKLVYLVLYIALVIYTVMFTWTYIKRALTMAFLTLMAPLVSITYPIDKMRDGQAQAFNMWLKEFTFNALLQPFHLIIYTIFVGSSIELAAKNPIYAIFVLACITPAEKLLRKMFGFDNSSTAGGMSTAAGLFGGAAMLKTAGSLVGKIGRSRKGGRENSTSSKKQVRTKNTVTDSNKPSLSSAFGDSNAITESNSPSVSSAFGSDNATDNERLSAAEQQRLMNNTNNQQIQSQQSQQRAKTWTENDSRGMGQWIGDNWRNSNARAKLTNSAPARFVRKIGNGARRIQDWGKGKIRKIPKPMRNTIRGAAGAIGHVAKGTAKFAGRAAITGIGAGIGATVGLAAGITGDDLEDVLKLGATGVAIGATGIPALGRGAANVVTNTIPNLGAGVREAYEQGAYGTEEAALRQQARELMADQYYEQQISQSLQEDLGREPTSKELDSAMQVGTEYYNAGITDTKDITKAMKTENKIKTQLIKGGMNEKEAGRKAREQSKVVSKMAGKLSDSDLRDRNQLKEIRKSIKRQILSKNDGTMDDAEANRRANHVINLIKEQKGI